ECVRRQPRLERFANRSPWSTSVFWMRHCSLPYPDLPVRAGLTTWQPVTAFMPFMRVGLYPCHFECAHPKNLIEAVSLTVGTHSAVVASVWNTLINQQTASVQHINCRFNCSVRCIF